MNVAIYARVSTRDKGQDCENHCGNCVNTSTGVKQRAGQSPVNTSITPAAVERPRELCPDVRRCLPTALRSRSILVFGPIQP